MIIKGAECIADTLGYQGIKIKKFQLQRFVKSYLRGVGKSFC